MTAPVFSRDEALAKVGTSVEIRISFSGLPQGTHGRVVRVDLRSATGQYYKVAVEWDAAPGPWGPLPLDWFTRYEYERFLEEVQ